jgi:hypothetical protein
VKQHFVLLFALGAMVGNENIQQFVDVLTCHLSEADLEIVTRQVDHVELNVSEFALYLRNRILELANKDCELFEGVLLSDELCYLLLGRAVYQ